MEQAAAICMRSPADGRADLQLGDAVEKLAESGHSAAAERLRTAMVAGTSSRGGGRSRWSRSSRRLLVRRAARAREGRARRAARRPPALFEAEMKEARRTQGRAGRATRRGPHPSSDAPIEERNEVEILSSRTILPPPRLRGALASIGTCWGWRSPVSTRVGRVLRGQGHRGECARRDRAGQPVLRCPVAAGAQPGGRPGGTDPPRRGPIARERAQRAVGSARDVDRRPRRHPDRSGADSRGPIRSGGICAERTCAPSGRAGYRKGAQVRSAYFDSAAAIWSRLRLALVRSWRSSHSRRTRAMAAAR